MKNELKIDSILLIEINEICELFLQNNKNCIRTNEIYKCLCYKDPISYRKLTHLEIRNNLKKLFNIHNNNKKNNTFFKISKSLIEENKNKTELKIRPISETKLEIYGMDKKYFQKI